MKPVIERCTQLRANLERLAAAQENEAKAQELEQRRKELEEEYVELQRVATTARVLLHHGHLATSSIPDCSKALESCDTVEKLVATDATSITKGRDYKYLLSRVRKVRDTLKGATETSWKSVVLQHQGVDDAFLRRVELFPGQMATVQRIRELRNSFEAATKELPSTAEAYDRFELSYRALQEEVTKLDPEAFPDDVLQFFRSAQQANGAPLALFTDGVREWLDRNGWLDGVRVRFTGER